jgi:hypothetical protein
VDYCTLKKCSNMILIDQPSLKPDADTLDDSDATHIPFIKLGE